MSPDGNRDPPRRSPTTSMPAASARGTSSSASCSGDLAEVRVILAIALIWVIFQIPGDRFLTATNLTNLVLQITAVGLISVGVVLVLLLGEIDLSVGAVSGLCAAIMAVLNVKHGWAPYRRSPPASLAGVAIGSFQGSLFTRFGIPSFVVTLAGLLAWQGAQLKVLGETGTVNITNPTIVGLTSTFYSDTVGLDHRRRVHRGVRAGQPRRTPRRRQTAGLPAAPIAGLVVRDRDRGRRRSSRRSRCSTPTAACRWPR